MNAKMPIIWKKSQQQMFGLVLALGAMLLLLYKVEVTNDRKGGSRW